MVALTLWAGIALAQTPSGTRILNEATGAFRYKTGVKDSVRSNMTATLVQSSNYAASSLTITVSPDAIIGNGTDTALVTVIVRDPAGNGVPDGATVSFTATSGTFPGGKDTINLPTANGVASVRITGALVSQEIVSAAITAATMGASRQLLTAQASLLYFPGAVTGSVVSAYTGQPVAAALVVARNASQNEEGRDTTGADGTYLIPVRTAGSYTHTISYLNRFGDQVQASFREELPIPARGGIPPVGPMNAISGNLTDRATGNPIRQSGVHVSLRPSGSIFTSGGPSLTTFQTTDSRGIFQFDSLSTGIYEIRVNDAGYAGTLVVHDSVKSSFMVDAALGIADVPAFEVVKSVNKRIAEIGDAVAYMLEIRNASAATPLTNIRIVDELPLGFVYVQGTSRHDRLQVTDPTGSRRIEWVLADSLQPGKSTRLSYMASIGSGAMDGDGVNHAFGIAQNLAGDTVQSAVASVGVVVRPGIFTDHGIVIGKVFFDELENGVQDYGEAGIAGVELWMEDGTHIITGDDGKYSLPDVKPGQHVIRMDQRTLPAGSMPLALETESAGDGTTRFIRLVDGGVARADFHVRPPQQASVQLSVSSAPPSGQLQASFVMQCAGTPLPSAMVLVDTLPRGLLYDLGSLQLNGSPLPGFNGQSRLLRVDLAARPDGSCDTVRVGIVRDSSFTKRVGVARPKLVISYPHHRDAVFGTVETFAVPGSPVLGSLAPGHAESDASDKITQQESRGSR